MADSLALSCRTEGPIDRQQSDDNNRQFNMSNYPSQNGKRISQSKGNNQKCGGVNINTPYQFHNGQRKEGYSQSLAYIQLLEEHTRMTQLQSLQGPGVSSNRFGAFQVQSSFSNEQEYNRGQRTKFKLKRTKIPKYFEFK